MKKYNGIILTGILLGLCFMIKAQTPCENGMAGDYPCSGIDMMSYMSLEEAGGGANGNDCWGWTDPVSGREFALFGRSDGTSFIEITDPYNPVLIGNLATHTFPSLWRDIKVFDDHAFIVSEAGGHGMQVFDLTLLLDVTDFPAEFEETAHYDGYGNAHNIVMNEQSGLAYGVGTSTAAGGLHIVDVNDPLNPVIAGTFENDGYTHDAQAVIYTGPDPEYAGLEIVFASNADNVAIINCENPGDCQLISHINYPNPGYTHQGWLTEDQKYFLLDDETDEIQGIAETTRTIIADVSDLDNPIVVGEFFSTEEASDHNMYVKGNYVYQSNYNAGLRVLDLTGVSTASPEEVAYFDVVPETNQSGYQGTWSNYPYFPSENIIISTFDDFFVVRLAEGVLSTENVITETASFEVYPNPANEQLSIRLNGLVTSPSFALIDANGKTVKEWNALPFTNGILNLNIQEIAPGIYFLKSSNSELDVRKVIIE